MKQIIKLPAVILGLVLLFTGVTQSVMAQDDDVSLETFYEELSPYGTWTQDPDHGYVWMPDVDQDNFRPYYTDGHWAMTEYGNTWVSDYDWGWAPFHYGRWITNRFNQWIWIPDTVWGPAWVSWRSGDGYYGWAPLSPGIDVNVGIGGFNIPLDWWVFIPQINIYSTRYPSYNRRNQAFFNRTSLINYTYGGRGRHTFYTGPRADDIRRVTRRDVTVYNVNYSSRPGRTNITNNNINIYQPGNRNGTGGRGSSNGRPGNQPGNQPGRNNPVANQPGRNNQGNGQTGNQPGRGNNPGEGRPGRNNNNGRPGQANGTNSAGASNPASGQVAQPAAGTPGRGNSAGNDQSGRNNQGRRNNQGIRPPVEGRDRTQQMQQAGDPQQQQLSDALRQQQMLQRQQQMQQQRDAQQDEQRGAQRQQQMQQRMQQMQQQRDGQQEQLREAQRQQQTQLQVQQREQQRQQRDSEQRQQRDQQRQQQDQQRQQQDQQIRQQQRDAQRQEQQRQQQGEQRQQQDQQRQQQEQQRQQQQQQQQQRDAQRQQQEQQRQQQQQQQQQQSRPVNTEGRRGRGN